MVHDIFAAIEDSLQDALRVAKVNGLDESVVRVANTDWHVEDTSASEVDYNSLTLRMERCVIRPSIWDGMGGVRGEERLQHPPPLQLWSC